MAKVSRKLLLALLTIAVCIALLTGGTYALFSQDVSVKQHLAAGNLSATLVRTGLETVTLDTDGHLKKTTNDEEKDFTEATQENLFGLTEGAKIAPGCKFTADLKLTNAGTVAFSYWIEVKLTSDSNKLAEQLKVTVKAGETQTEKVLSEGLTVGSKEAGIGTVNVGANAEFSVTVEFNDDVTNNDAKDQTAEFDFIVHAIQDANVTE